MPNVIYIYIYTVTINVRNVEKENFPWHAGRNDIYNKFVLNAEMTRNKDSFRFGRM